MKVGRLAEAQNAAGDLLFDGVHREQCVELHELRESPERELRIRKVERTVDVVLVVEDREVGHKRALIGPTSQYAFDLNSKRMLLNQ